MRLRVPACTPTVACRSSPSNGPGPGGRRRRRSCAVREREAKLGAGPAFVLPDLDGVIDGVTATALPQRNLDAVYYDTPDLRLARRGITVRHRTGEDDGWTVKLPEDGDRGSALVRNELTFPGARAAGPPPPVADLVHAHVASATIPRTSTRRASPLAVFVPTCARSGP